MKNLFPAIFLLVFSLHESIAQGLPEFKPVKGTRTMEIRYIDYPTVQSVYEFKGEFYPYVKSRDEAVIFFKRQVSKRDFILVFVYDPHRQEIERLEILDN